ncbi:protein kinase [Actinoallomurus purpureus]|uniref:serine/threonine-protein kinase n=1 Tax=Actinoallomurus purpureus TaxID=478114 RepID=UPI002093226C|nr:serine/threonine-protein kinase [Actinoallomurus purpureus]MCO6006663.1 protein kinase [Actinoallomurus purpureus]
MAESRDRLLSGRYRLIEEIGRGGMGTVWWAYDEADEREVAVKEVHLPPSLRPRERINLIKRTNREAMSAGRLNHPGLIAMYDVVIEDDRPWLVMEYVAARSLEDVFVDGPISPVRVAEIGRQLLDALRAAHEAGIVHRDVKPSNVLLETSGRVVLTDFGIATYEGATTLTQSGTFMGSPAYVAPEVARGEQASPASDLWSLGATLYAAVEGRPPYDFETAMATLSALVTAEPDPPTRAGPLRPLLDGLLRKDPARRLTAERAAALLTTATAPPLPPRPAEVSRARSSRRSSHEWSSSELSGLRRPGRAQPAPPGVGRSGRAKPTPTGPEGSDRARSEPPDLDRPGRAPATPSGLERTGQDRTSRDLPVTGAPGRAPAQPTADWVPVARPSGTSAAGSARGRRRLIDRPGMLPAVTGGVLALAVAAGVLAGLGGWAGPRDAPSGARSPAAGAPPTVAPRTPGATSTPTLTARFPGALPLTLLDASDRPVSRRVARESGAWPDASALTLSVPGHVRRVGVLVVCRSGARRLSFTAYALGVPGRTVNGDCAKSGRRVSTPPELRLPSGASHVRIRVRLRRGPEAVAGPIEWLVGAYESLTG